MPYTEESKKKLRQSMIKRYGSLEAWQAHAKEIAAKGGKNGKGGGFAKMKLKDPELHKELSSKGGKKKRNEAK